MRASAWWLSSGLLALGLLACNEILDNRRGVLREDSPTREAAPTQPAPAPDESATTPPGSSDRSAHGPDAAIPDDAPDEPEDAGACPPGRRGTSKTCGAICVSLDDPGYGCAAADCSPCVAEGGLPACIDGACGLAACSVGRADCNGSAADGCEADLNAPTSCGACGAVCPGAPHAAPACTFVTCTLVCEPGFGDCNGDMLDGCETNLADDGENCGQCGRSCMLGGCARGDCPLF